MSLTSKLGLLEQRGAYPRGTVARRWGQMLRESPSVREMLDAARGAGRLVPLSELGSVRGGVVTRANAYFLVRELSFDQIPHRFRLTRHDMQRVAVVMDGLETPHRLERRFLKPVIKGPEVLVAPGEVEETDLRLVDINLDKKALRAERATGAIEYLRRGETVAYKTSEDSLKGGIPAERSQVKNRKPHWYSLSVPTFEGPRIVLPEHLDRRYIATVLNAPSDSVVIDKLFTFTPNDPADTLPLLASLNSLLTWYQLELRGRTQHGEGVLELKIPDWSGVLVANPSKLNAQQRRKLVNAFTPLLNRHVPDSLESAGDPERTTFDTLYLHVIGVAEPEAVRLSVERALRTSSAERRERRVSVVEAKLDRKRAIGVTASVDAYASRLAASMEPYPDPRRQITADLLMSQVPVLGPIEGKLTIGTELFSQGHVYAGDLCVAQAGDLLAAQFVRAVLLHDPHLTHVDVPAEAALRGVMREWNSATDEWWVRFDRQVAALARGISDARLLEAIRGRALILLHADS